MIETRGLGWVLLFLLIGSAFLGFGMSLPAWLFYAAAAIVCVWLPAVAITESAAYLKAKQTEFTKVFFDADPETRAALGLKYPKLRLRVGEVAIVTVDDSDVELKNFKTFMRDSNTAFMAPRSNYGDRTAMGKQWKLFKAYLQREGAVLQDRGKVTETWRFVNEKEYWRYYNSYVNLNVPPELLRDSPEIPAGLNPLPGTGIEGEL